MKEWLMIILIHLDNTIRETHVTMRPVKLFLFLRSPQEERWEEDLLGKQNENKKHHLEERVLEQTPEVLHLDYFELRDGKLCYRANPKPLIKERSELRAVGEIYKILGKEGLCNFLTYP